MPKRKAVKQLEREDSELTPPPDGLLDELPADTNGTTNGTSTPGKKRKIKQEVVNEEEKTPKKAARTKKSKVKVEIEEEDDAEAGADETSKTKTKRKAVKKEVKEEGAEDDADEAKPEKKKRQSKADKEADMISNPLAARTIGHKLFIGAHVSASGGQSYITISCKHMLRTYRRPQLHLEQCPHWSQCFRPLPQIATKVGKSRPL